jgi:putative aldouronate transport system substrate-binding protein
MNYLWSDEGIILFNYGEEGVSFEYDSDGNPQLTELVLNNPDGLSQTATSEIYLCVRCIPILKDNISMYDDDTLDIINVWMEGADTDYKVSENVSLTFDENSTITSILGDVNTYVQEMTVKFITGEADIDAEIDNYNAMLISMGIEDAIAVEQEAVDRYNNR